MISLDFGLYLLTFLDFLEGEYLTDDFGRSLGFFFFGWVLEADEASAIKGGLMYKISVDWRNTEGIQSHNYTKNIIDYLSLFEWNLKLLKI